MTGPEPTARRPLGTRADEPAVAPEPAPAPERPTPETGPDRATSRDDGTTEDRLAVARRVHVDLPRVRPEDMVTTQEVEAAPDPEGGRDTERDFMLRYAGGI